MLLTFSTVVIRSVWYSMSALEVSDLLTGQNRGEGRAACRGGVGALCKAPGASGHAQSSGKATQELGHHHLPPPLTRPFRGAPGQPRPEEGQKQPGSMGLSGASPRLPRGPGDWIHLWVTVLGGVSVVHS